MTRTQAIIISLFSGLALLVFAILGFLLLSPDISFSGPTATLTPSPTPTVTLTPTFPNFMPTASLITPTPPEPTPTNTRVPTATPAPTRSPTPTVDFRFPTPAVRPTASLGSATLEATATKRPTATLVPPRQYDVSFEAEDSILSRGQCTDLIWSVEGQISVQFNGEPVEQSGRREVCPERDTNYILTTQLKGSAELQRRVIRITVRR